MYRFAIIAACTLAGCASTASTAPAGKFDMALRIVELQYSAENMRAYGEVFVNEYRRSLPDYAAECLEATDRNLCEIAVRGLNAEIERVLKAGPDEIAAQYAILTDDLARLFADAYTHEELAASLAFIESPVGRSMNEKAPALTLLTAPLEYDAIRPWTATLQARIEGIMNAFSDTPETDDR